MKTFHSAFHLPVRFWSDDAICALVEHLQLGVAERSKMPRKPTLNAHISPADHRNRYSVVHLRKQTVKKKTKKQISQLTQQQRRRDGRSSLQLHVKHTAEKKNHSDLEM